MENAGAYLLNLIVTVVAWLFENIYVVAIASGILCLVSVAVEIRRDRKDENQ